jgi:hypothetical protein
MTSQQILAPVLRTLATVPQARTISLIDAETLLGLVGLTRRYGSRLPSRSALVAAGMVLGATAALLLAPSSGRDLRTRVGKLAGGGFGKQVGKLVGSQVGGHPVATAKVVQGARDLFGSKRPD